jgi:hypothetical protein
MANPTRRVKARDISPGSVIEVCAMSTGKKVSQEAATATDNTAPGNVGKNSCGPAVRIKEHEGPETKLSMCVHAH